MSACFCSGPASGETFCPCQLRDISKLGSVRDSVVVQHQPVGWKCVVCGKGNAPFQKSCANAACGIDFSKGFHMSEKIIDPLGLLAQVRPDADPYLKRLFGMRVAEEFEEEQAERAAAKHVGDVRFGPVPDAQLVYDAANHTTGVAVRGAKYICPLPKGYGGPGCELAMVPQGLIVVQPDKSSLLIDPTTGTTRRL